MNSMHLSLSNFIAVILTFRVTLFPAPPSHDYVPPDVLLCVSVGLVGDGISCCLIISLGLKNPSHL